MDNAAAFWIRFFLTVALFVVGCLMVRDLAAPVRRLPDPGERARGYALIGALVLVYAAAGVYVWLP